LKVAGLFSGIGGFEAGLENSGLKTTLMCEKDELASLVLKKRFPKIENVGDISALNSLPNDTDVVCAGFPCQNLSMAGNKKGVTGDESKIVLELFRLLRQRRVPWVVIENVYFMLHLNKGSEMAAILGELETLGYSWAYRTLDTRGFSLAQRRRRVFIVASCDYDPRSVLLADDVGKREWPGIDLAKPTGFYWTEGRSGHGLTCDAIPPLKNGSSLGIPSAPAILLPDGRVVTPTIEAAEMLQGFPARWTSPVRSKDKKRFRWRLVGNSVSVPIAEWLGNRLIEPGIYDTTGDKEFTQGTPWPYSAYNMGNGLFKASVSEYPVMKRRGRLSAFKMSDWPNLSDKAISGFIRRAREPSTKLRYPSGFLEALERFRDNTYR